MANQVTGPTEADW